MLDDPLATAASKAMQIKHIFSLIQNSQFCTLEFRVIELLSSGILFQTNAPEYHNYS